MITAFFTMVLTVTSLLLLAIRAAASLLEEEAKPGFYEECVESAGGPRPRSLGWTFKPRRASEPDATDPWQHLELK